MSVTFSVNRHQRREQLLGLALADGSTLADALTDAAKAEMYLAGDLRAADVVAAGQLALPAPAPDPEPEPAPAAEPNPAPPPDPEPQPEPETDPAPAPEPEPAPEPAPVPDPDPEPVPEPEPEPAPAPEPKNEDLPAAAYVGGVPAGRPAPAGGAARKRHPNSLLDPDQLDDLLVRHIKGEKPDALVKAFPQLSTKQIGNLIRNNRPRREALEVELAHKEGRVTHCPPAHCATSTNETRLGPVPVYDDGSGGGWRETHRRQKAAMKARAARQEGGAANG